MRLITLGDSATAGCHNWPTHLSEKLNCELVNLAKPASQNLLQVQLMQEWLLDNELLSNDIIIWQIGFSADPVVHISFEHWDQVERAERLTQKTFRISHYHVKENKIDNEKRISLMHISPIIGKFNKRKLPNDEAEVLQTLLFMFVILKKLCPRLLIMRGRDDFVKEHYWDNMKKILKEKNIDYIDKSIVDWCVENNLDIEYHHPTTTSIDIYTTNVLYPKLFSLGWLL